MRIDRLGMTIAVYWDIKPQTKQTNNPVTVESCPCAPVINFVPRGMAG